MSDIEPTTFYDNGDQVVLFKCIVDFVHALKEMFGEKQHSLELYDLLMEKTGLIHQDPINKHIHIFYKFLNLNSEGILKKQESLMETWIIEYSDKVYIDLKDIFKMACESDKEMIWIHLLTMMAVIIPTSSAKSILMKNKNETKPEVGGESNFLRNIVEKVGQHIDPSKTENPAEMMSGIMQSGVFNELVDEMNKGVNSGEINIESMIGNFQNMMGSMSDLLNSSSLNDLKKLE